MPHSLISELERALFSGTGAQRLDMLSRITDLFLADIDRFTPEQVNLFDAMLTKFVSVVETKARAQLADRLAPVARAPSGVIRTLAFDDDIEVARPVLRESSRIEESDLVTNAATKSQGHLLAIAERNSLSEEVTDVLVARGGPGVAQSVAKNPNARLSFAGFRALVRRANGDDDLALLVGSRADLPRQQMLRLLDEASSKVRAQLENEISEPAPTTGRVAAASVTALDARNTGRPFDYATARPKVEALHRAGKLDERAVVQCARDRQLAEIAVGLALLCEVDVDVVEQALKASGWDVLLILIKIAGFSWTSGKLILLAKADDRGMSPQDLDRALATFSKLNVSTARRMLAFYHVRSQGFAPATAPG